MTQPMTTRWRGDTTRIAVSGVHHQTKRTGPYEIRQGGRRTTINTKVVRITNAFLDGLVGWVYVKGEQSRL